eukprot:jgi/Tetstr1/466933/TSEL_011387.t1
MAVLDYACGGEAAVGAVASTGGFNFSWRKAVLCDGCAQGRDEAHVFLGVEFYEGGDFRDPVDEVQPYVPAANHDFTPYPSARNYGEAIDKAFRFHLSILQRLNEIKRVHGDHVVLDVLRAQHFQPAAEHLDSAVFGDLMRDYERRVFEATVANNAKAAATAHVHATLAG